MTDINDLLKIGNDILHDVTGAIESGDYSDLGNRTKERIAFAASQLAKPTGRTPGKTPERKKNISHFFTRPQNRSAGAGEIVGGTLGSVVGGIGAAICFGLLGTGAIAGLVAKTFIAGMGMLFGIMFLSSLFMLRSGIKTSNLIKRYFTYGNLIGYAEFFSIKELADKSGLGIKSIIKDLQEMIRRNMIPGARIDDKKTTLLLTDQAYSQYMEAEKARIDREKKEQEKKESEAQPSDGMDEEVRQIIDDGNRALVKIREINNEIPDSEVMSDKLYRLEDIMRRIFEQVRKNPSSASDLRRFMDYYLPTTTKLLTAYVELDRQPVQGENISKTRKEIEDSMDTINDAFERILDGMFSDMAEDISVDISVMKTMLEQDGLSE